MEISGRLKQIDETKAFGTNGFRKREFVVTTDEQYPQHIMIELTQDKCDLLDNYRVGQSVKVSLNLRGREWVNPQGETKYFNSIQGWRIESLDQAAQDPRSESEVNKYQQNSGSVPQGYGSPHGNSNNSPEEEIDDLPF